MSLSQSPATADEALAMVGVTKTFPGVRALEDVSFSVRAGEVHALIGENGAGKSTLLKILSGVYRADAGETRLAGQPYSALSPKAARQAGIAMIHQELQQIPRLDVAQNMFLGTAITRLGLFTDKARMREKAREVLALLDANWSRFAAKRVESCILSSACFPRSQADPFDLVLLGPLEYQP